MSRICGRKSERMDGKSEDKNTEADTVRFICPRCKILYEHGGACIRCGAMVVDPAQAAVEEEPPPAPARELESGEISLSSGADIEEEAPKARPPQEEAKEIPVPEKPISLHRPLNRLPGSWMREAGPQKKKGKRLFRLSWEVASVVILIGTALYLCWSIYSHFSVKRPEASTAISKDTGIAVLPHSPTLADPPASSPDLQGKKSDQAAENPLVSKEGMDRPAPQAASPAPPSSPAPEAAEEENIRNLLRNIQQGNLRKDIDLFMSCYSSTFKGREGKRKETLETWEHFNYFSLSYDLKNCSISAGNASARVEWRITYTSKGGGRPEESRTVLDVKFNREDNKWKIVEVRPVS